jgi:hypothetical protein
MMSASHRKRDSREALVRWLRDRSSGGRSSHSGTFDCRSPIFDCTAFPPFSIESRQSKSPKILAGNHERSGKIPRRQIEPIERPQTNHLVETSAMKRRSIQLRHPAAGMRIPSGIALLCVCLLVGLAAFFVGAHAQVATPNPAASATPTPARTATPFPTFAPASTPRP